VLIADAGVHANYRNSPFCSECQRVVLQPRSARSGSCVLSAKAARALNRAALETNCRTFRFHPSTSKRTKSPFMFRTASQAGVRPAFQITWQLWKWHDRLALLWQIQFTPQSRPDPSSAVRAALKRSHDEIDDSVAHGWQAWLRWWSVDSFFPASLG
jgi:hypothetical protein